MVHSCRGPTKQVRTHCAACLQRTKWLCRGFDDVLATRLSGSGSYGCWCGGSGEGAPHPWPVFPKSTPCRICPAATEKWEWYSSNACWLNSHGMHNHWVSAVILAPFGSVKIIKEMCQFVVNIPVSSKWIHCGSQGCASCQYFVACLVFEQNGKSGSPMLTWSSDWTE